MGLDFIPPGGQSSRFFTRPLNNKVQWKSRVQAFGVCTLMYVFIYIYDYICMFLFTQYLLFIYIVLYIFIYTYLYIYNIYIYIKAPKESVVTAAPKNQLGWKFHLCCYQNRLSDRSEDNGVIQGTSFVVCLPGEEASEPHHISCIAEADDMFVGNLMSLKKLKSWKAETII